MTLPRAMSLAGFSLCIVGATLQMGGCSSVPRPAEADGHSRVPANDAGRVEALQQRVKADRQLLTDNNLLHAQVEALQAQLVEMTALVREALTLPPAPPVQIPTPAQPVASPQPTAAPERSADPHTRTPSGVVIRVFHRWGHTEFEPSEAVAQSLRTAVQGAERIEVRGHTDSNVVNPVDRRIAAERAENARTWLLQNGADAAHLHTTAFTARHFLADNRTAQGRSVNRRVEIDIRHAPPTDHHHLAVSH